LLCLIETKEPELVDLTAAAQHFVAGRWGEATPLVSNLYRAARIANDVSTLALGNPHRIARRAKNKIIGRAAARAGVWRALWR
jgi:hypothetical protein